MGALNNLWQNIAASSNKLNDGNSVGLSQRWTGTYSMAAADRGLAPLPQEALSEKLLSYEAFLNDKLRVDLK